MSRLDDVAGRIAHGATPATKGYGHKAWETRRTNQFLRAMKLLITGGDLDELRLAAVHVGEYIAARAPEGPLPRGYAVVKNRIGDPALALEGELLSPSFAELPPSLSAIGRLGNDLKTGWLREVEEFSAKGVE